MFDVVILFGSIFANGYDSGVMSSLQANANWLEKFDSPKGQKLGAIVSAYSFRERSSWTFLKSTLTPF